MALTAITTWLIGMSEDIRSSFEKQGIEKRPAGQRIVAIFDTSRKGAS
jgi:hypothetical protein